MVKLSLIAKLEGIVLGAIANKCLNGNDLLIDSSILVNLNPSESKFKLLVVLVSSKLSPFAPAENDFAPLTCFVLAFIDDMLVILQGYFPHKFVI